MKIKLAVRAPQATDDDAFEGGGAGDSDDSNTSGSGSDDARSTRQRSKGPERRVTRPMSMDQDAEATPGGSDNDEEEDEGESNLGEVEVEVEREGTAQEEPVELGSDLDPINSGAVTPGLVPAAAATPIEKARSQFAPRRKETKVRRLPPRVLHAES